MDDITLISETFSDLCIRDLQLNEEEKISLLKAAIYKKAVMKIKFFIN